MNGTWQNGVHRSADASSARPLLRLSRGRGVRAPLGSFCLLCVLFLASWPASAADPNLRFDTFLGYDNIVPESGWFPIVCEIKNDGPPFKATIEVTSGAEEQMRKVEVELPTGSLKRLSIPVFPSTRSYNWDVRLLDEKRKVRAEYRGLQAQKQIACETPLIGALPRTASGTPLVQKVMVQSSEWQPSSARFQPPTFPDNPLVLEGMTSFYLNSERASALSDSQVAALLSWLKAGGHLIVAVEQIGDITASSWLSKLLPCELTDVQTLQPHPELQDWVRSGSWRTNLSRALTTSPFPNYQYGQRYGQRPPGSGPRRQSTPAPQSAATSDASADNPFPRLPDDFSFETAAMQIAVGKVRDGHVLVASGDNGDKPLIVRALRGRGQLTLLLFSPEREPFRSWKNQGAFWAKLTEVPGALYVNGDFNRVGRWGSDGIFGAMIDSRQVHKLPIEWLLLLLVVYLLVIGPVDQFWLKKIGRPMLTWITFPCYVVLFSLLIYFIGYKLRAGESELNELHLVDLLPAGDHADLRGRTYSSVYSPANQKYEMESSEPYATLRGEVVGGWANVQSSEKATVTQKGDGYKAEVFVPVWTSQLFVSDWWQSAPAPLSLTVSRQGDGWDVKLENRTDRKLANLQLVVDDHIANLGDLAANESKTINLSRDKATGLKEFIWRCAQPFQGAVQSRQRAFGSSEPGHLDDVTNDVVAASFLSQVDARQMGGGYNSDFLSPPGLDLTSAIQHGNAVLFAWDSGYSPVKPAYHFSPRRSHRDTVWRVATVVK